MNEPPERENDIQDSLPKECALRWDRKKQAWVHGRLGYMPQKKARGRVLDNQAVESEAKYRTYNDIAVHNRTSMFNYTVTSCFESLTLVSAYIICWTVHVTLSLVKEISPVYVYPCDSWEPGNVNAIEFYKQI